MEEEFKNNKLKPRNYKKIFKEIYFDDFDDPNEEFVDVLYDLIPDNIIENELKKIKSIKSKYSKIYSVEQVKK